MGKYKLSFWMTEDDHRRLIKAAAGEHKTISDYARGLLLEGMRIHAHKQDVDFIRLQIREELKHVMEPYLERMIKLMAKSGRFSAQALFLCSRMIEGFVPPHMRKSMMECIEESRKAGAALISTPERELETTLNSLGL